MKNIVLKLVSILTLLTTSAMAESSPYTFNTSSLVGIEGSYSSFDVENDATPVFRDKVNYGGVGLKIGAQTDNYRLFLSARYNLISGYDYAYLLGAEIQYLFNFSSFANFYLGVNGGIANLRFEDSLNDTRDVESPYVGGDLGLNFHLGDSVDFELGGRVMKLTNSISTIDANILKYKFDNIVSGYASIIFKYHMD